jgi:glycosyltransferase involved in cell wall biosynthesis
MDCNDERVRVSGKFFRTGSEKWYARGLCYGPFASNGNGDFLPEPRQLRDDFAHIRKLGGNCVRVFYPPPAWLLDEAAAQELRVFVDVPWEKHRCFFEDWEALERARHRVRDTARVVGRHPGVFAISVANEIPADVIRFYGRKRVGQFVGELLDSVKQEAPECLVTYVNFPTTEFFEPETVDFYCFNVYIHDERRLGVYLDRLQHIAGNKPLILGEYGIDTIREGDIEQARHLQGHIRAVFEHGLAGSFIFSYTDDWFTSGRQIDDWAFGVTQRDRTEKVAAKVLRTAWSGLSQSGDREQPRVSVVVCSYNGAATLRECLDSLMRLDYADYEVILVDDGSTDGTREIAKEFPQVFYHYQANQGLSVARNVGAQMASGEIIAYTDSDCVADEHWLLYLVQAMRDQNVEAIGGPNVTPASDGWIAKCIAASPGNPSHVMLDDQHAEHVPGCNLAIRRTTLLGMGGFDPQFRQAGDDVDLCWRLLDADLPIGYAPGAMVWHHRRATVSAFIKQQKGYGRSEAMVHFKHPQRCSSFGRSSWHGIIYGAGAVGLPLMPDTIYHGRFGGGLFQLIYRHRDYGAWAVMTSLEWHLLAAFLLVLATQFSPLALASAAMWLAPLLLAARSAATAPLETGAPRWCRLLIAVLYFIQPIVRGFYRMTYLLSNKRLPRMHFRPGMECSSAKQISATEVDLYWQSEHAIGRERLLEELIKNAKQRGWCGDFGNAWAPWDIKLIGDRWHDIMIGTATEELGWPKRFTRARCTVHYTRFSVVMAVASSVWAATAAASQQPGALSMGLAACTWTLASVWLSRRRCLSSVTALVARGAERCGLASLPGARAVDWEPISEEPAAKYSTPSKKVKDDSGIVRV